VLLHALRYDVDVLIRINMPCARERNILPGFFLALNKKDQNFKKTQRNKGET
jgi:hypothetical protein